MMMIFPLQLQLKGYVSVRLNDLNISCLLLEEYVVVKSDYLIILLAKLNMSLTR